METKQATVGRAARILFCAFLAFPYMLALSFLEPFASPYIFRGSGLGWPWKFWALSVPFLSAGFFQSTYMFLNMLVAFAMLVPVALVERMSTRARIGWCVALSLCVFMSVEFVRFGTHMKVLRGNQSRMDGLCDINKDGACTVEDWNQFKLVYPSAPYDCSEQPPEMVASLDADADGCIDSTDAMLMKLHITGTVSTEEIVDLYSQPPNPNSRAE